MEMSNVVLYEGDCLDVMPTLAVASVDAIITDLPYGATACKWDIIIPFEPMWREIKRILKPHGAFITTARQPFTSMLVMSNLKWFKHEWIWKKNAGSNFALVKFEPMLEHESVLVFGCCTVVYNPQRQKRAESGKRMIACGIRSKASNGNDVYGGLNQGYDNSHNDIDFRVPSSVQYFNRERGLHPTQKPVGLYEYLINTYTNEGDLVLDIAMGSGTTGVACIKTKRNFVGIDNVKETVDIAQYRIEHFDVG